MDSYELLEREVEREAAQELIKQQLARGVRSDLI